MKIEVEQVNEVSLLIRIGDSINSYFPALLFSINKLLLDHFAELITDTVPAYTTLLVSFDDGAIASTEFVRRVEEILFKWQAVHDPQQSACDNFSGRDILIPVYYHFEVAPDLEYVAQQKQLSSDEVIQMHCRRIYTVYAIGFAPGFAFLGDVDERIAVPRLDTPRQKVAKGSIGIAGQQTGIYPRPSPGGWNIIGRTAKEMFFPEQTADRLCPLRIGDRVRFSPVTRSEFLSQGGCLD